MPWYSISKLSEITGLDRRTVKKRLNDLESRTGEDNRSKQYDTKQALPALYQLDEDDRPDVQKESALLSRERRKKTRIERMVLEGGLVPASEVVRFCYDMNTTIRNKILSIPSLLRNKYPHVDGEIIIDVEDVLHDSLTELADDGIPTPLRDRMGIYLSRVEASTESDGQ